MKNRVYLILISAVVLVFLISSVFALSVRDCKKECSFDKNQNTFENNNNFNLCKENCAPKDRKCITNCSNEKRSAIKTVNQNFSKCNKKCSYVGKNITCLNGKYAAGEVFLNACEKCECGYNSKISCTKTDFCNFNASISKNYCESNNGFYNSLCNGPYFDIVCSKDLFCLCDGVGNYSCASDYSCLHSFSLSLTRRSYTIPGWKNLLGKPLGDIGICVKKPILLNCGNGICENKVVDGKDAESSINCPEDCI